MAEVRILHVLDHSIPLHSGYTFRTLAILREQRALGWETWHLTSPKHAAKTLEEDVDGWLFHRTPARLGFAAVPVLGELELMRLTRRRLHALAREVRPDVIHAHSPVLNALPALSVGRQLGIPVVYEVRAFWEDAAVDHGTTREGSLRYRLTRGLETYALRRAAHVTTICEGLRSDIVARGIPADRVTVIPNAVDVAAFAPIREADAELQARLGLAGRTVVGFIGSFYAYEGLDLLLRALAGIRARAPDLRVLLVGGGPQESELKALARTLGVEDLVLFVGRVPQAQVHRYYSLVDVLAYPRHPMRLTEIVTPLKPLEAMAQERLLIASDVGGHRELIRDGDTGVLFKAGDVDALREAIGSILADHGKWAGYRSAARRFVENERTWRRSVERYAPVYAELSAGHKA